MAGAPLLCTPNLHTKPKEKVSQPPRASALRRKGQGSNPAGRPLHSPAPGIPPNTLPYPASSPDCSVCLPVALAWNPSGQRRRTMTRILQARDTWFLVFTYSSPSPLGVHSHVTPCALLYEPRMSRDPTTAPHTVRR